jgi:hypothetical protein
VLCMIHCIRPAGKRVSHERRIVEKGAYRFWSVARRCRMGRPTWAARCRRAGCGRARDLAMWRSAFLPLLGQTFRIAHGQGSLSVVLSQVNDLKPTVRPGAEDQFSLIFTGARLMPALSQETYSISHARRGRIALFIVPVGMRETAQQYQAIIDSRPLTSIS